MRRAEQPAAPDQAVRVRKRTFTPSVKPVLGCVAVFFLWQEFDRRKARMIGRIGPALRNMLANSGIPDDRLDEGVAAFRERYRSHGEFDCVVYNGMAALLTELQLAEVRLATATSTVRGLTRYARNLVGGPPLSIEGTIGPHRAWAHADASLADVKAVGHALGGTVNDVAMLGAQPRYLTASFILEEGFSIGELESVLAVPKLSKDVYEVAAKGLA